MTSQPLTINLSRLRDITNHVYYPKYGCTTRNLVLRGGAGSGKSVFASQKLIVRSMAETGHCFGAFRKVARTLKTSVFAQLRHDIETLGVSSLWKANLTESTLTFLPNGNLIRCIGLDDSEKLKSIFGLTGAWMEEATEFTPGDYEQVNLRIRGITEHYKQIILSFNPISALHWIKARFFDCVQDGRTTKLHTTFRDNRFIDEEYKRELEALKERDVQLWAIYAEGEWGVIKGTVYKIFPEGVWPEKYDERIYCLDFGFNNPMALLEIRVVDQVMTVKEQVYQSHMTTADLIEEMKNLGIDKKDPIYGDPAEPDRIKEIAGAGYNIKPAWKGPGSVNAGISFVKAQQIRTLEGNVNFNRENQTYKWAEDKNGVPLDKPVKFADHAMDALRYGVYTHYSKRDQGGKTEDKVLSGLGVW